MIAPVQPSLFSIAETVPGVLPTKKAPTVGQNGNLGPLFAVIHEEPEALPLPLDEKGRSE